MSQYIALDLTRLTRGTSDNLFETDMGSGFAGRAGWRPGPHAATARCYPSHIRLRHYGIRANRAKQTATRLNRRSRTPLAIVSNCSEQTSSPIRGRRSPSKVLSL